MIMTEKYTLWREKAVIDEDLVRELAAMEGDETAIEDAFFRDLEFGEGRVDFDACVRTLLSMGVRMFNCEFWYDGHTDPETYIRRNADYVKAVFART